MEPHELRPRPRIRQARKAANVRFGKLMSVRYEKIRCQRDPNTPKSKTARRTDTATSFTSTNADCRSNAGTKKVAIRTSHPLRKKKPLELKCGDASL